MFACSHQRDPVEVEQTGDGHGQRGARIPDDEGEAGRCTPPFPSLEWLRDDRQGGPHRKLLQPAGVIQSVAQRDVGEEGGVPVNLLDEEYHRLGPAEHAEVKPADNSPHAHYRDHHNQNHIMHLFVLVYITLYAFSKICNSNVNKGSKPFSSGYKYRQCHAASQKAVAIQTVGTFKTALCK